MLTPNPPSMPSGLGLTSTLPSSTDLPEHQPEGIDVGPLERLKVLDADSLVDNLWSEVALRSHSLARGILDGVCSPIVPQRQPEIRDAAGIIGLHQDVTALEVPVCDGRFSFHSDYFSVEVIKTTDRRIAQLQHFSFVEGLHYQDVVERPVLAELSDQPQLGLYTNVLVVGGDKTEYVGVSDEAGLIDLDLVEPRRLFPCVENLHSHFVSLVRALPDFPISSLADQFVEGDLSSNGTLD